MKLPTEIQHGPPPTETDGALAKETVTPPPSLHDHDHAADGAELHRQEVDHVHRPIGNVFEGALPEYPALLQAGDDHSHEHTHHSEGETHHQNASGGGAQMGDRFEYDYDTINEGEMNQPLAGDFRAPNQLSHSHKQLDEQLEKAFPNGVTFHPPFADEEGADAADAKWALLSLNNERSAHGDHLVNLNGVTHRVSTNVNATGHVAMTIHGEGGSAIPEASRFDTRAKAVSALQDEFSVTVSDRPQQWTRGELEKVHAGLSLLSSEERKALRGVTLERHADLGGTTTAEFAWSVNPTKEGEVTRSDVLKVADFAFMRDTNGFVGDGSASGSLPPSTATIAHEAGHAIDSHQRRDATFENLQAVGAYKQAFDTMKEADAAMVRAYSSLSGEEQKAARDFWTASREVDKRLNGLLKASPDTVDTKRTALAKAMEARNEAFAALPEDHPLRETAEARNDVQDELSTISGNIADSAAALAQVEDGSGKRSTRLANFDAFVQKNNIPAFTDYAASGGVSEFYAEALSLYRTDPTWMESNSPKLFGYFEADRHLQ